MGGRLAKSLDYALFGVGGTATVVSGYCLARGFGWHPQLGTVGEWLAAVFTAAAAGAALHIATRDRQDRRDELAADRRSQAKVVMVDLGLTIDIDQLPVYRVIVTNHGTQPILDVSLRSAAMSKHQDADAQSLDSRVDIVSPGKEGTLYVRFVVRKGDSEESSPPRQSDAPASQVVEEWSTTGVGLKCWVQFADAHGNRWAKSTDHELEYLGRIT